MAYATVSKTVSHSFTIMETRLEGQNDIPGVDVKPFDS